MIEVGIRWVAASIVNSGVQCHGGVRCVMVVVVVMGHGCGDSWWLVGGCRKIEEQAEQARAPNAVSRCLPAMAPLTGPQSPHCSSHTKERFP